MFMETLLGQVRHWLTGGAGALVTNGVLSADDAQTVIGSVIGVIGIFWSALDKFLSRKISPPAP